MLKPSSLSSALDFSWDIWRDRAYTEYNTPFAYFDLPKLQGREISGIERYLEVQSYYTLTPQSGVKVYPNGAIEGVYEAYAGIQQALLRNDPQGVEIFYPRLNKKSKAELRKLSPMNFGVEALETLLALDPLLENRATILEFIDSSNPATATVDRLYELTAKGNEQAFQRLYSDASDDSIDFLTVVIESGRVDWLDMIIRRSYPLPQDVLVANIPVLPFDPQQEAFPLYDLGIVEPLIEVLLVAAISSTNPQIVDFFRSLFRIDKIELDEFYEGLYPNYISKTDPVGLYSTVQRLRPSVNNTDSLAAKGNIDALLLALRKSGPIDEEFFTEGVEENLGNIPFLLTFIQQANLPKKELDNAIESVLSSEDIDFYPLSRRILESL